MLTDKKLQVYLPNSLAGRLERKAQQEGKKVAQVVRESLELYLSRSPQEQAREAYGTLDKLLGAAHDDGSGTSERHDEILGRGRW